MDRAKWVVLKVEIVRVSVKLVRLDCYVSLLTKSKYRLKQKCTEMNTTLTTLRRQRTGAVDSTTCSAFCCTRTRRAVLMEVNDIVALFKYEGV